jgi:hypothetical protein
MLPGIRAEPARFYEQSPPPRAAPGSFSRTRAAVQPSSGDPVGYPTPRDPANTLSPTDWMIAFFRAVAPSGIKSSPASDDRVRE